MTIKIENVDPKAAASYRRALAKVDRAHQAVLDAKGDVEITEAVVAHEKAKASYGKTIAKLQPES